MTIKLSSVKADLSREEKGDWIPSPDFPGVEFNVSSLHLPAYQTALTLMEQRLARAYKGVPVPPHIRTVEVGKLLHKHILHDWRGFDEPYSEEVASGMMCEPEGRNFIAAVQNCAAMVSLTDVEFVEEAGKNSSRPSATGSGEKA
ncbi:hypothetical protein BFX40_20390 [Mesorhizobium sp. SEMIA 3007]|uniref:hypothetical protein n=1 Tax=Mesorhizobium sp. SEMIA 3007 TaxID=1862350 RepID=UPI00083D6A14|nr:hypothetical protein [Mesorhizobium sp. SEMIA 3007]ODA94989.1 hypothetical protein BFX40_20390 [Mesorhizobium sp. SEMIA 3007]